MTTLLTIHDVSFQYHKKEKGIHHISFSVEKGEWVTLIGKNGSGKTTLGKVIMGLLPRQSGEMYLDNEHIGITHEKISHPDIAYVFQNPDNQFVGITVEEDIAFGLENRQVRREDMQSRIDDVLKAVRMSEFAQSNCDELSGGQKQRVAIASALVLQPKLLILDEATTMLDPVSRIELLTLLKDLQKRFQFSILSITHHHDELQFSDRVVVMNEGVIEWIGGTNQMYQQQFLGNYGLELTLPQRCQRALQIEGALLPQHENQIESVAEWLWKSYLNK